MPWRGQAEQNLKQSDLHRKISSVLDDKAALLREHYTKLAAEEQVPRYGRHRAISRQRHFLAEAPLPCRAARAESFPGGTLATLLWPQQQQQQH
jgi:hypothetical protein